MGAWKPLLAAAAAAFVAVGALALVPSVMPVGGKRTNEVAVFRLEPPRRLAGDNLVDALAALRLENRLRRVDWRGGVLYVDFDVPADAEEDGRPSAAGNAAAIEGRSASRSGAAARGGASASGAADAVFRDMNRLIGLAFRQADNADRLLVRFLAPADGADVPRAGRLLLAADIRRGDKWLARYGELPDAAPALGDPAWRSRLRLSATDAWRARFGGAPAPNAGRAAPAGQIIAN